MVASQVRQLYLHLSSEVRCQDCVPGWRYRWKLELIKGRYERGFEAEDVRRLIPLH